MGIQPLFDSGSTDGLVYYVVPLVEGETLRARIDRDQQLPIADVVRITQSVANALFELVRRDDAIILYTWRAARHHAGY